MAAGSPHRDHGARLTYLVNNVIDDPRVLYWHTPEDLRKRVLNNDFEGNKRIHGPDLDDVLDKFNIVYNPDDDNYYAALGQFMSLEEATDKAFGYAVNYGNPIGPIIRADPMDSINATFLMVYYKHKTDQRKCFTAYYVLYSVIHIAVSVCIGRL